MSDEQLFNHTDLAESPIPQLPMPSTVDQLPDVRMYAQPEAVFVGPAVNPDNDQPRQVILLASDGRVAICRSAVITPDGPHGDKLITPSDGYSWELGQVTPR